MQSLPVPAPAMEVSLSFLTPTGELPCPRYQSPRAWSTPRAALAGSHFIPLCPSLFPFLFLFPTIAPVHNIMDLQ